MTQKIKCPVCGSELKAMTKNHLGTKRHREALQKKGISPKDDPALKYLSTGKKPSRAKTQINRKKEFSQLSEIEKRLINVERIIEELKQQQNMILSFLKQFNFQTEQKSRLSKKPKIKLEEKDILTAINICMQNNNYESRWVLLDDVISVLKLNQEEDRKNLYNLLIKMFNKNKIDLAEGGDPKYPLIYQNRVYGTVAIQ